MRVVLALLGAAGYAAGARKLEPPCDVLIAGGSLASLAAAITAANVSADLTVCFTDPTDWPGGQMTASGVPAIDFGVANKAHTQNVPASLRQLLYGPLMPGGVNLGSCWVSSKCFQPQVALQAWIMPTLAAFPNLVFLPRTTVTAATRDAATGAVTSVSGVQREPPPGATGWEVLLSAQLADWYDPAPSAAFPVKTAVTLRVKPGGVAIEATEFGDLLVTSGAPFAQGVEAPTETSAASLTSCGQGITLPFYVTYGTAPAPVPDPVPPGAKGLQNWTMQGEPWAKVWTYRRVHATSSNSSETLVLPGDLSCQNIGGGNDYIDGYILLDSASPEFRAQLAPGAWRGGVNLTTLAAAEQRAFAFYHFYTTNTSVDPARGHLYMNATPAGTASGLAKMPYMRDSRRSAAGLGGYRLTAEDLWTPDPARPDNATATRWNDTVGIGVYFYADIHRQSNESCPYPDYIHAGRPVLPYYFPLRALTVESAPNLLVAGKSISQTFFANAATRLHPEEWTTGAAAGAIAALMVQRGWAGTADALAHVPDVQALLASERVGLPLEWTL